MSLEAQISDMRNETQCKKTENILRHERLNQREKIIGEVLLALIKQGNVPLGSGPEALAGVARKLVRDAMKDTDDMCL